MRRGIALAAYVVALALFAGFVAVPFVTKKHDTPAEVPSPPPVHTVDLVNVQPRGGMCMSDLVVSAQSRSMRFAVGTYRRPGPGLRVSIKAPGYSSSARVRPGYADNSVVQVPIPAPPSSRAATVCVANTGKHKVAFYGAA